MDRKSYLINVLQWIHSMNAFISLFIFHRDPFPFRDIFRDSEIFHRDYPFIQSGNVTVFKFLKLLELSSALNQLLHFHRCHEVNSSLLSFLLTLHPSHLPMKEKRIVQGCRFFGGPPWKSLCSYNVSAFLFLLFSSHCNFYQVWQLYTAVDHYSCQNCGERTEGENHLHYRFPTCTHSLPNLLVVVVIVKGDLFLQW